MRISISQKNIPDRSLRSRSREDGKQIGKDRGFHFSETKKKQH